MLVAVTCIIYNSYSNILQVHSIVLAPNRNKLTIVSSKTISASTLKRNTYKVTKMHLIPDSDLVVVILQDYGG